MLRLALTAAVTFALVPAYSAYSADWPQYRGPAGDGTTPDKVSTNWAGGPKVLWKVPGGTGFSSFAVAGNRCFTIEGREEGSAQEILVARDLDSGKELWTAKVGSAEYGHGGGNEGAGDNKGGDGPRSSPAIVGNAVITLNADLALNAHDAATGKPLWTRDLMKEHDGRNIMWKNAASPLIEGGLVYVAGGGAGQSFLAIDPKNGAVVGKSGDDTITHATPVAATILGQRQIVFFTKTGLTACEPKTMKQIWHADFPFNVSTAASPVVIGDVVYCSAGYNVGAAAFKVSKSGFDWKAEQIQRWPGNKPLANHWSTPVLFKGHLYGMFQFKDYAKGPIKCVAMPSGDVKWEKEGFGPGHAVLTNGNLLALSDAGELVLIAAKPDAYTELARAKVIDGKCWTTPVVSNGRVFVRSTKEAACVDLRAGVASR
ncbi:MAG TPA: PQQ-binding-like beta-propeller repeat protein [Chthoniobacteraceae bacterium]|nr:PQQ-binding-like beta-propeller repeat protein [Chthoniobacteraceae bacterium]